MKKIVLNSPRLKELKRKKHQAQRKKMLFLLVVFLLFFIIFIFLSRWEKLNINNIEISGNKVIESKMIEGIAREELTGYYFYFFPKTNFLFFPKDKIEFILKDKFKRIKDISVNDKKVKTLNIYITERTGLYTYCGMSPIFESQDSENNSSTEKCYFIDQDGFVFDEAPYFSGDVYLKFYGDVGILDENLENASGKYFYKDIFKKLISLRENLEKINIKPIAFHVKSDGDVDIFISSSKKQVPPKIILKSSADFEKVIENLQSVLNTQSFQNDFKEKYSSLLYIDLRFGNKVYYKFK